MKEGIFFIGSNDMREINSYIEYKKGIFIEPIPEVFEILKKNLNECNIKNSTNFIAINELITDKDNIEYEFNIFGELSKKRETQYGNNRASSSILDKNDKNFWGNCDNKKKIKIKSITIPSLLLKYNINIEEYPNLIIDVQGAELLVLKNFGEILDKINFITTEYSNIEYYKGQVLFPELNKFITQKGFKLLEEPKKKTREY